ncbi:ATP-dependent helicase HrpB [Arthrobacter caoxuetaonis]|uniref:ATP-dependent helicase HrpB n=1 Tax=Arthrobacter caoxuetaonis TaxID=2886935 RepID=A0A9X1MGH8_9MICC|nr:ATP-dependent helicase HrpB [Arthrobacter caoxuetaonis]MCC3298937.1 ATP-dependent helicase HrpB [Arthrobacter caoxuetaonis]USQ58717.1 ATP-dependent helicase HrpB [Arthrobacter caoxuetaonis]
MSVPGPSAAGYQSGPFDLDRIGAGLVFARSLSELAAALRETGNAVVQAPPGTGKTTLVPPLAANLAARTEGPRRVVVTQPRRVAARTAARRLAALDGGAAGGAVGYTVRGESLAGPDTVVEFVTPGILLRRLLADPSLQDTAAVVLDEVHERGLESDLLVGMLAEVRELREGLMLIAMSATLETSRFAELIAAESSVSPAPVIDCPSVLHPLDVRWQPTRAARLDERGVTRGFLDELAGIAADAHARALAADPETDALVFVPGAREVSHVASRLMHLAGNAADVVELHGQVRPAEQDRAVSGRLPHGRPRIIVATSLAESSLTVPGVRLVVDSGLAREPRRDAVRGMSGLVTVSCSRASAQQRAGRAARQGPGTVVRAYPEAAYAAAPAQATPEAAAADLTTAALLLACWGTPGGRGLRLPDPLPPAAVADAEKVLRGIGAIDSQGLATPAGRKLARIPADPQLARALLDGTRVIGDRAAAEITAMVAGDYRPAGSDLGRLLSGLRAGTEPGASAWSIEVRRMERLARTHALDSGTGSDSRTGHQPEPWESVGYMVALAFPARVARRVAGSAGDQYLLASGTRAGLPPQSSLAGREWLAIADVTRAQGRAAAGTGAVIRAAAPLEAGTAEAAASHLLSESVTAVFTNGKVAARRQRRLGSIELESTPVRPTPAEGRTAVAQALQREGLGILGFSPSADALRRRLGLLHRLVGAPWPDVSEPALLERVQEWLGPELEDLSQGARASGVDLLDPLRRLLPWPEAARLEELAPERLLVPSGSKVQITYPEVDDDGGRPVVAVKLQECFGWAESPRLAGGRARILFHLLSPAGRPLAVTDDLASFWAGPYSQVRAEMRGRYPRHPWPEDPWSAVATARTKARM